MIAGLHGMVGLPVSSGGSSETLLRTIKVKLDTTKDRAVVAGWNWWSYFDLDYFLLDSTGATTGIKLKAPNTGPFDGVPFSEDVGTAISDADFPSSIMNFQIYPPEGKGMTYQLEGVDTTKRYKFHFAGGQNYDAPEDKTSITINSVTKDLLDTGGLPGPNTSNILYRNTWTVDNPTTNLPIVVFPKGSYISPYYACHSALIIQEFSFTP